MDRALVGAVELDAKIMLQEVTVHPDFEQTVNYILLSHHLCNGYHGADQSAHFAQSS